MVPATARRSHKRFTIPYENQKFLLYNIAGPNMTCRACQ
jgi:hypothetical protein